MLGNLHEKICEIKYCKFLQKKKKILDSKNAVPRFLPKLLHDKQKKYRHVDVERHHHGADNEIGSRKTDKQIVCWCLQGFV